MEHQIKRAAVIGAGVMGSGIAAHIANAGIPVLLLDIPQSGFGKKNALAEGAIARMKKNEPAAFMSPEAAKRVTAGNTESDLEQLKECDWIVEAIIEKLDIKRELYEKLEKIVKPEAIVSSNTSTIPLKQLMEGRSAAFRKQFFITHFFNPPRYTRLLEIVASPESDPTLAKKLHHFADVALGKGVVHCKDSPGFIANRIGTFWIQKAMVEALDRNISVEEADAIFSRPFGIPKTGVFGLVDLVGLDLIPLVTKSMQALLPPDDRFQKSARDVAVIQKLIEEGYTGRKGKGGFYRLSTSEGKKVKEAVNLKTGEFAKAKKPTLQSLSVAKDNLKTLLAYKDKYAEYAWEVISEVLCYSAELVGHIADDIVAIDMAMKLGYNWKYGPFELLDRIGVEWFSQKLKESGKEVPAILQAVHSFYKVEGGKLHYHTDKGYHLLKRPEGVLLLEDIKRASKPIAKNASAALWDIGDGIVCLEFCSKMNSLDPDIMKMIRKAIEIIPGTYKALVIYNEGSNFSAGVNLGLALFTANVGMWPLIEQIVEDGQMTYKALKYAPFPVISAPSGIGVGGGCEILLSSDGIEAHAESYLGLVEVGVGVIPAWGGCKEMLTRWLTLKKRPGGAMVAIAKVFEMIGTAKVAKSAHEAREMMILREDDGIVMNRDRLLAAAKTRALKMAENYQVPESVSLHLPGPAARVSMQMAVKGLALAGKASSYDIEVTGKLAHVLSGGEDGDCTEDELLKLEREVFNELIRNPKTLARIEHILETGKPLRN
ncbi:3-hydroxyacyl-CoA dehydrogenase/enoyl-CoA hydratase family protein [Candidatus Paracaedibacter symbiosus]|uniref:3-hydroxyacyl-CoA dehydrogenase/enoyl-CoA hydratase family protein n=1 Tax=Candidatus Paracaedibacter symbiosus TaxID=244582 RepID=UPI000509DD86|nr:3-hydroxyacyl-CoA dehydrogenase/enoyl-CoA hydratase family protein [Candidatus Paracaedibacter symbiosus]